MYLVCSIVPMFNDRDAFCGNCIRPNLSLPAYETLGMANLAVDRLIDKIYGPEGPGYDDEINIGVFERLPSGQLRKVVAPAVACEISYDDDIEF